ncbi:MAG: sensor histidine kinase [Anaerolineae bacterium]
MPVTLSPETAVRTAATEFGKEIEQLKVELREIEVLVRQTGGEIERLSQRQMEMGARLRQVENNMDAYSREDIRGAYAADREAQLKLMMMRSQLEQFQNKQRYLDRYITQLRRVNDMVEQFAENLAPGKTTSPGGDRAQGDHDAVVQTIEAQESERQRLAQQMHDGPAQSLTNLILQAEIVERLFESNPERARSELGSLKTSANTTFQRVRDFIFGLRPMMLDDLGLVPTLRRYTQNFEAKNKLPITLAVEGERKLPQYVDVTIFRAVQELLNNVAAHAHASHVQVSVDIDAEPTVVQLEDDGSGFEVNEVLQRVRLRGTSGLSTLEKRVEMLGGKIMYQSGTGRGTKVRVLIPST